MKKKKKEVIDEARQGTGSKKEKNSDITQTLEEARMEDTDGFKELMRMDFEHFKEILDLIESYVTP